MTVHNFSRDEIAEMARPRPTSWGTHHLNCAECAQPGMTVERRHNGEYCIVIEHRIFIYLEPQQLRDFLADINAQILAALDEG